MRANLRFTKPLVTVLAAVLAVAFVASAVAITPMRRARVGEPAPPLKLVDVTGKTHDLADYKGKTVVLQWFNPECPFVVGAYREGVVKATLEAAKKTGNVVFLAVDSSANRTEEVVKNRAPGFLEKYGVEHPVLVDHDGTVGKAYDARTTPQVFVIDGKGIVRYIGAPTDDPSCRRAGMTNHVITAFQQGAEGKAVTPDTTRPWGCSVKYDG
jgi:peroxiredoxin